MEDLTTESNPEERNLIDNEEKRKAAELLSLQTDIGRGFVYNMRLSKWYIAACACLAASTLAVVLFLIIAVHLKNEPLPLWVVILDGFISTILIFETIVDMIFLGRRFWSSIWHVFDLLVSVLCLAGWILLLLEFVEVLKNSSDFVWVILLTIRYIAQVIRIIRYGRVAAEAKASQDVVEEQVLFEPNSGRSITADEETHIDRIAHQNYSTRNDDYYAI